MKKRAFICFLLVFVMCACIFASCATTTNIDDETLRGVLATVQSEAHSHASDAQSYTLKNSVVSFDTEGNEVLIYVDWRVENTNFVTIAKGDGVVTVNLPESRGEALNYKLRATLVDGNGEAYKNGDETYSALIDCTAPITSSGGGTQGGGGTTPGGGGTTPGGDQATTISVDFSQQNYGNEQEATDITVNGITIDFDAGTNGNPPKWYDNGSSVRLYGGNTVTISGATITKVVIHFSTKEYDTNEIVPNVGTFQTDTWTGSTNSLVLTISGTKGNRRFASMDITIGGSAGGGSTTPGGGGTQGGGGTGSVINVDFTAQGYADKTAVAESQTISGLNFKFEKGSNSSTAASYYVNKNGDHLRLYADNTMTISGKTITKVVFTFAKYDETNPITVNVGTFTTNTWTGSADSVSFHVGENEEGWHGHRRIVSLAITVADGGTQGGGSTTPGGGGTQGGGGTTPSGGSETTGAVTFDFTSGFVSYAASWGNSYVEQTVTSANLGIQSTVEFVFSAVSKQTNTISDRPVLAAKPGVTQYLTVNGNGKEISSVTFNLKMWDTGYVDKLFTEVCIEYTTNGSTWTKVDGVGFTDSAGKTIEGYETLTASGLPAGVTSVRLSITGGGESGNQQVGISGVVLSFAN